MNKVVIMGRWTRDPDVRYNSTGDMAIASGTLAVDRRYKKDGEATADFISVKAFGKTAEIIEKYCFKGHKIMISGRIQTGSYTNKEGQKVYTADVIIEEMDFCEKKNTDGVVQEGHIDGSGFVDAGSEGEVVYPY